MAHERFTCEVLTPEGEVFSDEVEMVSTRTTVGSIGIMASHQPLLGMLDPTELRLYTGESEFTSFAQGEGYVQVTSDRVLILVEEAVRPEDLDSSELKERVARAESELSSCEPGTEAHRVAARGKRRAEAFLAIAAGGSSGS